MINLLPPEYKKMIKNARANRTLVKYKLATIAVAAVVVGVFAYGMTLVESSAPNLEDKIEETKLEIQALEEAHQSAKSLSSDIDLASKIINREIEISELLNELADVLPSGVVLTNLTLSEDRTGPIKLDIDAVSAESVSVAQVNIQESDLFTGAEILFVQSRESSDSDDTPFTFIGSINAYFNPDFNLSEESNE